MSNKIYVIGHVNPDTDSIASAIGYAWLLRERDNLEAVASRAGAVNPQTAWVLKRLEIEAPFLLTDASPRFESIMQRLDSIRPDSQLGSAWTLASRTGGLAPVFDGHISVIDQVAPDITARGLIEIWKRSTKAA